MHMASYSHFGEAMRDAVGLALESPQGCVVMNEELKHLVLDAQMCVRYMMQSNC